MMNKDLRIQGVYKQLLEKTEWVAIVTWDGSSPHTVATWGNYIRVIDEEIIVIPAGHYHKTEENLKRNRSVQVLIASRKVEGSHGPGQGCRIYGEGEIQLEGEFTQMVKEKFSWARGALVVRPKEIQLLL